jgi:hypothetical protein
MRRLILATVSVLGLGVGGAAMAYAMPPINSLPSSSSAQAGYGLPATPTTQWMAGYGVPATRAQMARVWQEVKLARIQQQQRHAGATPFHAPSSIGDGAPV